MSLKLDSLIKGGGKYGLKCEYAASNSNTSFSRNGKWNLTGCNGILFWLKPDGSGREIIFELNIADMKDKNSDNLWDYSYLTEKDDSSTRWVTIPFFNFKPKTRDVESPAIKKFRPEAIVGVSLIIGGGSGRPAGGSYYFDELAGAKLQF